MCQFFILVTYFSLSSIHIFIFIFIESSISVFASPRRVLSPKSTSTYNSYLSSRIVTLLAYRYVAKYVGATDGSMLPHRPHIIATQLTPGSNRHSTKIRGTVARCWNNSAKTTYRHSWAPMVKKTSIGSIPIIDWQQKTLIRSMVIIRKKILSRWINTIGQKSNFVHQWSILSVKLPKFLTDGS
jgi:hypothetical protein